MASREKTWLLTLESRSPENRLRGTYFTGTKKEAVIEAQELLNDEQFGEYDLVNLWDGFVMVSTIDREETHGY